MKLYERIIDRLQKDIDRRMVRQGMPKANIATAETPGSRPVDLKFQEELQNFLHPSGGRMPATQARLLGGPPQESPKTHGTSPTIYPERRANAVVTGAVTPALSGSDGTAAAENWWKTVFIKGVKQELDPEGLGFQTKNRVLTAEEGATACDRSVNPAIITSEAAWAAEQRLHGYSGGTYEGPGYYGPTGRVWAPGDLAQRPGEETTVWSYRTAQARATNDTEPVTPALSGSDGTAAAENWWKTVFIKGVTQELDPEGLGFQTKNRVLTAEEGATACDRSVNPAIITSEAAWAAEQRLHGYSGGTYEGPGYYGPTGRVWAPGDLAQRPGEETTVWLYRTALAQAAKNQRAIAGATDPTRATQDSTA